MKRSGGPTPAAEKCATLEKECVQLMRKNGHLRKKCGILEQCLLDFVESSQNSIVRAQARMALAEAARVGGVKKK